MVNQDHLLLEAYGLGREQDEIQEWYASKQWPQIRIPKCHSGIETEGYDSVRHVWIKLFKTFPVSTIFGSINDKSCYLIMLRTWVEIPWTCRGQSSGHLWTRLNRKALPIALLCLGFSSIVPSKSVQNFIANVLKLFSLKSLLASYKSSAFSLFTWVILFLFDISSRS